MKFKLNLTFVRTYKNSLLYEGQFYTITSYEIIINAIQMNYYHLDKLIKFSMDNILKKGRPPYLNPKIYQALLRFINLNI